MQRQEQQLDHRHSNGDDWSHAVCPLTNQIPSASLFRLMLSFVIRSFLVSPASSSVVSPSLFFFKPDPYLFHTLRFRHLTVPTYSCLPPSIHLLSVLSSFSHQRPHMLIPLSLYHPHSSPLSPSLSLTCLLTSPSKAYWLWWQPIRSQPHSRTWRLMRDRSYRL